VRLLRLDRPHPHEPGIGHARVVAVLAEHGAVSGRRSQRRRHGDAAPLPRGAGVVAALRLKGLGLRGVVILAESQVGVWGEMEIVRAPGRPN